MGMYATVYVDESIDLSHYPEELDRGRSWQSKRGVNRYGGPYRITEDGRLEERLIERRDKKDSEKRQEAQKWGFDNWESYIQAYEERDEPFRHPEEVEYDPEKDNDKPPRIYPEETVVSDKYWKDVNKHGSFEFHSSIKADPIEETKEGPEKNIEYKLEVYMQYEARFTDGDLDEIVFLGERFSDDKDPVESALEKIEQWREYR